jgi:PKD repeat protein
MTLRAFGATEEFVVKARRILCCAAATATGLMSSAALALSSAMPAQAQLTTAQDKVVSSVPASFTPSIDGGAVLALARAGSWTVAGGSFTSATPHGSSTAVPDSGIVAFDQSTGALDTGFAPTLDGQVDAVIPGPTANTVYVGGQFSTVNGVKSKGITLLNLSDGSIVAGFKPPTLNGIVEAMRLAGGRLYLTGTFTLAGGVAHGGLATLNPATGALSTFMNVQLTGHHSYNGTGANGAVGGRAMDISPDGTRAIVVGNFKDADGAVHDQIVMLDLTGTSAAIEPDWNTGEFTGGCASNAFDSYVEDVSFAPDGSYFAIATTGGGGISSNTDGSRSLCDSVSRWATTDTGSNVQPTWVDYTGNDSFWTVAVTGTAIYVGGHERWANNPNGSDGAAAGAVPRPGMAAFDPVSGLPLAWNPGRNPRGHGATALLATSSGLYVGSDTNYIGNFKYKRDEIAFFPLSGGYSPAPTATGALPANVYEAGQLPDSANSDVLYRVDAGGPALAATDNGPDWLADQSDADPGGAFRDHQSNSALWSPVPAVDATVPASTPSAVFDSERWSPTDSPPMTWDFPVASGTQVQVRLYFANRYSGTSSPGQRVFDVSLNGTQVLAHYDIVASVGDQTGTMQAFDVTVPGSGSYASDVNLAFTHQVENPLIDGIEIVKTGASANPPGGGSQDDLAYRAMSGSKIGALTTVPGTGISWGSTRGAFMVGPTIFYGDTSGNFHRASFDGKTVGSPAAIDPYDDPAWDSVATGSGQTYQGAKTGYYGELPNVTGAFYADGRLYYSLLGQPGLRWRYFSPDSGIVGGQEFTAAGGNFANVAGDFLSGSTLYYASRSDGTLHSVSFSNGGTNGTSPSVDPSTDATVSGPAIDGNDWRSRGLFAFGSPTFPDQPPTAQATVSCTNLTCSFDGTGSSDPDGTVASYGWDFGDGSAGTGATPSHGYATAGTYTYTLTVTDNDGVASAPVQGTVVATGASSPISFTGSADGYSKSGTSISVTTPAAVSPGDTELLYVTTANATANVIGTPAGWTKVTTANSLPLQAAVFERTATAADAGSPVTASVTSAGPIAVQLADYANAGSQAPVTAVTADSNVTSHTAPAVAVASGGSWVVSFWSDKSSTTTAWTLPGGVTQRDQDIGTGGGHVTAAIADSNGAVATGTYPPQSASVGGTASGKGAMISLVLAPPS